MKTIFRKCWFAVILIYLLACRSMQPVNSEPHYSLDTLTESDVLTDTSVSNQIQQQNEIEASKLNRNLSAKPNETFIDPAVTTPAAKILLSQAEQEQSKSSDHNEKQTRDSFCSKELVGKSLTTAKGGWYILSEPYESEFDAELQSIDLNSSTYTYSVVKLSADNQERYFLIIGPFSRQLYAKQNYNDFVNSELMSNLGCVLFVPGKAIKNEGATKAQG